MTFDKALAFFDKGAITASVGSLSKDYGLTQPNSGKGTPLFIKTQVDEDFATCTSVQIAVQDSADDAAYDTITETAAIPVADLVAGYEFPQLKLPNKHRRYVRVYVTVAGTNATSGKITSYIDRA